MLRRSRSRVHREGEIGERIKGKMNSAKEESAGTREKGQFVRTGQGGQRKQEKKETHTETVIKTETRKYIKANVERHINRYVQLMCRGSDRGKAPSFGSIFSLI